MVEAVEALPPDAPAGDVARRRVPRARGRARRPPVPGDLPRRARRGSGRVRHGRRRPRHPRQARPPPSARLRRHRCGDVVGRDAELGADQEGREGCDVDRGGHHARAAVAAVRAQADPQGGVGRARPRRTGRRAAAAGRRPRRAPRRTTAGTSRPQLGDLLAAAIVLARSGGVDAESALRGWAVRFRRRFEAMERLAEARQLELSALTPQAVAALWIESGGEP